MMKKLKFTVFYQTPLYIAIETENIEIVKLLLSNRNIKVNLISYNSSRRKKYAYQIFII